MLKGVLFVSLLGTFMHFVYSLSGNNFFVGLFAPINESVWEHTKLIYFPMLIYSVYLNKKLKGQYSCIFPAMILSSVFGMSLIISVFYTYSGIIGFHTALVDIAIFYVSVIAAFFVAYKLISTCKINKFNVPLQILNILMICLFIIFTLFPPSIPLFISP